MNSYKNYLNTKSDSMNLCPYKMRLLTFRESTRTWWNKILQIEKLSIITYNNNVNIKLSMIMKVNNRVVHLVLRWYDRRVYSNKIALLSRSIHCNTEI